MKKVSKRSVKTSKESPKTTSAKAASPRSVDAKKSEPKIFKGAAIVRGQGMGSDEIDDLLEEEALDEFDATTDLFIVVADDALEDLDASTEIHAFRDEGVAICYAQALSNGNVDHRVLHVTQQTLVVATMNRL